MCSNFHWNHLFCQDTRPDEIRNFSRLRASHWSKVVRGTARARNLGVRRVLLVAGDRVLLLDPLDFRLQAPTGYGGCVPKDVLSTNEVCLTLMEVCITLSRCV